MNRRKAISVMLTLALAATVVSVSGCKGSTIYLNGASPQSSEQSQTSETYDASDTDTSDNSSGADYGLTQKINEGTILHAWCWSFNAIKESMADIAAAGYSSIQTSPVNAVVEGGNGGMQLMGQGKWYYQYQPVDWTIGNYQLGTEDEFKAMCDEAHKYGIKIIVDVVPNHTTPIEKDVSKNLIDAVGGEDKLYHKNGKKEITNYSDRTQCTTGSLSGLPDVNTENPAFQDYFVKYLNRCIADGADGFRYDTAKHIALSDDPQEDSSQPNNFWETVTTKIDKADTIFNYGEVLQGDNERIKDYIKAIGHTTASSYGSTLRSAISNKKLDAESLSDFKVVGSKDVVTWVESHDNYTDGSSLKLSDKNLIEGWAVIAAIGDGTPLFFDRPFEANSDNQWGSMNRIGAAGSTLYKDANVSAVNHFRNAMVGESTKLTNPDSSNKSVLMIERGSKGVVLVNTDSKEYALDAQTSLADGTYTSRSDNATQFTVSGGKITGNVPAEGIAVLYNDNYKEPVSMPSVSIETASFVTTENSVEITLHAQNADSSSYKLDGTDKEFKDGDKVTVPVKDSSASISISATKNGLTSTMTYYFTKLATAPKGTSIFFEKPSSWGDKVYAYIYDETVDPTDCNAEWSGEEMIKNSDGTYSYTLLKDWKSALVIFSDGGKNQYPAPMEPGAELVAGQTYKIEESKTEESKAEESKEESSKAQSDEIVVTFKKPSSWSNTINAYVYENGGAEKNAAWPGEKMTDNGDGTYSYTVPSKIKNAVIIFNDGKKQYPGSNKPGMAVENGKTYTAE